MIIKTSSSQSKEKYSYTDFKPDEMSESFAEAKFLRSDGNNQEFEREMRSFPRELSARLKFVRNLRTNSHIYRKTPAKLNSISKITYRNLPKLTPEIIAYAIEMNLMHEDDIKGLIVDPNKYSVFFEDPDLDSPNTRNALRNLDLKPELVRFPQFQVNFFRFFKGKFNRKKIVKNGKNAKIFFKKN